MARKIADEAGWDSLRRDGLTTVIDPMVYRCGELFLKGRRGVPGDEAATWELLDKNVHAIGTFFDRLVLDKSLAVFDYADTFDQGLNFNPGLPFDQWPLTRINQYDPVFHDVRVEYPEYTRIRNLALDEVRKVFESNNPLPAQTVTEIDQELAVADYRWNPNLLGLENTLTRDQKSVARFLLGGLVFQSYAQIMGGDSLLQPKRSRLFLAVNLKNPSANFQFEDLLFDELRKRVQTNPANPPGTEDVPWTPTFFPYLLSQAKKLDDLLPLVADLRKSPGVDQYRGWLGEATADWRANGSISTKKRNDVAGIAASLDHALSPLNVPKVEVKLTIAGPSATADLTPWVSRLWGWFVDQLPRNRYRKLLTRAVVADKEYASLVTRVKTLWDN